MRLKDVVLKVFLKLGYGIYRIGSHAEYTLCPPYDYWTYSPWFEERFQEMYSRLKDHTMVSEDRCYVIHGLCLHCLHLDGDFAECGVYRGGTAFLIGETLAESSTMNKQIHLFDTFAGMPSIADEDPSGLKQGALGDTSLNMVKDYLKKFHSVVLYPGFIPDTLKAVQDKEFAFVHVDVDLYETTRECCNFFYERMTPGGVMIFDDYGFVHFKYSEKRAVDEFFKGKPESTISLPTGQCIVIKL